MMKTVKKVPEFRFPEFEGEWAPKKIKEIGKLIGGGTPDSNHNEYWAGTIPWISSSDINESNIQEINISRHITVEAVMESATKLIPINSVLIVSRVGIGKFAVNKQELCTSQDFTNLIPFVENSFFLAYYFLARKRRFLSLSQGTSIKGFTGQDIGDLTFQIPSLPEQQKIASFLSAADQRIQLLTQKKEKLVQYKKGIMQQIFSQQLRFKDENGKDYPEWEEKRLGDTIKLLSDYTANGSFAGLKENVTYYSEENYAALVRTTDLEKTIFKPERFTDKHGYDFLKKTSLRGGEIILANVGSIGKVYRVPSYNKPMTLAPNTYVIKFNSAIDENFIYQLMNRQFFKNQLLSMVGSTTLKAINKENLRSIVVEIPCIEEQQKIASFLSNIDNKISLVNQQIELTRKWKQGLLQKMFV